MSERALFSLIHVSDLHIAEVDHSSGNGAALPPVAWAVAKGLPYADGLIGHGAAALRDLESLVRSARFPRGVPRRLLVSGDFTRCGSAKELALAHDFLGPGILLGRITAGLGAPPRRTLSIPGNHDQWGGFNLPVTGAPSHYASSNIAQNAALSVGPLPACERIALPEGHQLTVFQVDSDADVPRLSSNRLLARGEFDSQLAALRKKVPHTPPASGEIRVLIIHHSYSCRNYKLAMGGLSKRALFRFVSDYGIRIVLSGHTHVCEAADITNPATNAVVAREISCGSSAQLDHVPPSWTSKPAQWGGRQVPNSLVMHDILKFDDGSLLWRARPHYRDVITGFQDIKNWWEFRV